MDKRGRKTSGTICVNCHGKKEPYAALCMKCRYATEVFAGRNVTKPLWEKSVKEAIRQRDGDGCGYCGIPLSRVGIHLDHIKPESQGGGNDLDNLVLACEFCNMAKHDHELEYFLSWLAHIRSGYFECRSYPIRIFLKTLDASISDKLQKGFWD